MASHHGAQADMPHGVQRDPLHTYSPPSKGAQKRSSNATKANGESKRNSLGTSSPSGLHKIRQISMRMRKKFHLKEDSVSNAYDQPVGDRTTVAPTLAPSPTQDGEEMHFSNEAQGEPSPALPPLKDMIYKPVETLKSVAHKKGGAEFAENVADTDPTHSDSVKLVLAHESIAASATDQERLKAVEDFEDAKKIRQDSFVRWTMSRHVRKVMALPTYDAPLRSREEFVWREDGKERMHWLDYGQYLLAFTAERHGGRYIGASAELPDPTQEALNSSVERVLLNSVPFQNMFMQLRDIALWRQPAVTAGYAALYFSLCMLNCVTIIFILYVVYSTIKSRFYPPTIPELREKLERSEDSARTAQDIHELVEQHGAHEWIDALVAKAGPTVQLQLDDLADLMEIMKNFYEWRDPRRTQMSLAALLMLCLIIIITPVWLLVKGFFFGIGIAFFVFLPLSNRWPQYRLLISPSRWLFWKVPTHGEWAVARLRAEGTHQLQASQETNLSANYQSRGGKSSSEVKKKVVNIGRYDCTYEDTKGILYLDNEAAHFSALLKMTEKWRLRFTSLKSMQKLPNSSRKKDSGSDLLFIDQADREFRFSGLMDRDEAFTQIIGYSGVDWRVIG